MRVDVPKASDDAQYHVHVTNKKLGIDAAEGVNGEPSHKKTLAGSGVPKKIIDKVKEHKDFKNAEKKQKKLDDAAAEIKAKKLDLNKTEDIIIAIAVVVAATATFFFPGDDVLAWGALLRAVTK
ncbi:hypothetical protein [Psychrobacillus sp.]|uniref:hypothetical protein n=1 Tax=Psychrobacillus sp. TaxID=1871623 RepID=UPI0028BDACD8|nr:hypothetical protein [Psychrobacillus sp.]